MGRGLANLNGLRALEAVMRHRSYIHAAEELHVTPAAIGQQIRALEAWLGLALFERNRGSGARLVPFAHTEAAMADLSAGFALLQRGLTRIQSGNPDGSVRVTTSPAFGARWLVGRLGRLKARHPDINVEVDVSERVANLQAGDADCAIRYGIGPWPGLEAQLLLREELFPAAAPSLLKRHDAVVRPQELLDWPLIEDNSGTYMADFPNWQRWFAQRAQSDHPVRPTIQVNLAAAAIEAAIEGAGVGLVRSVAAYEDIRSGRLVRLFPELPGLPSPASYWLLTPTNKRPSSDLLTFIDWIRSEAQASGAQD